jgi:hypothetical protein
LQPVPDPVLIERVVPLSGSVLSYRVMWRPAAATCAAPTDAGDPSSVAPLGRFAVGYSFNASASWDSPALIHDAPAAASVQLHAATGLLYTRVALTLPLAWSADQPVYFFVCAINDVGPSAVQLHRYMRPFASPPRLVSANQLPGLGGAQILRVRWDAPTVVLPARSLLLGYELSVSPINVAGIRSQPIFLSHTTTVFDIPALQSSTGLHINVSIRCVMNSSSNAVVRRRTDGTGVQVLLSEPLLVSHPLLVPPAACFHSTADRTQHYRPHVRSQIVRELG